MDKKEFKTKKKEYKKARRKAYGLWKGLGICSGILSVILIIATVVVSMFDNTMAAFMGGSFWDLKNEDKSAQYFTSDFASGEELEQYGLKICQQVEAEGAALLFNNNNALPLMKAAKVSCFSSSSVNLVYGGTGSGNIDASKADNLKSALEKTGMKVNDTLWNFYTTGEGSKYKREKGGTVSLEGATVNEVPWSVYTDDVTASVAEYGDAGIIVISRVGGEGADLTYQESNYLALDDNEKDMMVKVASMKQSGKLKKTILLINSANPLQVDFLKNNDYNIDACLWIGDVGISGINAVADILAGNVNPSGSLVDTYCYDNYSAPAMKNFTPVIYGGYKKGVIPEKSKSYMIYQEGIYIGYKYYETRYEDFCMGTGNAGDYKYENEVAYPFGFGLSYTEFSYSDMHVNYNASTDKFEIEVKVTNTGDAYAGKETVQIYVQSPYTQYDIANNIEKSSVALCGFGKTDILAPGKSETLTIYVDRRDIASYDAYGAGTYVLDKGDYYFTAATDAHDAVNNVLAAKGYTIANTNRKMDKDGNPELTYCWNNDTFDSTTYSVSANGTKVENQLSQSDINLYDGTDTNVIYLTRNNWLGTFPEEQLIIDLTDKLKKDLQEVQYNAANYPTMDMPVLGAKNGMQLYDMIGKAYDDPQWQPLLDQLEFDEMVSFIGDSFHWTMPVPSVNAPGSRDENGPQGLTASLIASDRTELASTAFTSEDVMAATFNVDLMTEIGKVMGNDCVQTGIACLYGPGNNIHRTPFCGRNFEYYSEDGFLSGKMSAYEVGAIQNKGVHVVMKHFALNDSEQDRIGLGVWLTEQAARELYLKAFQAPVEEGNANGVMTAYTRFGCIWSGGNHNLITNILRNEWGCEGLIITDNVLTTYVNGVDGLMAGVSTFDAMLNYVQKQLPKYKDDPVIVAAMKEASHRNLFMIANSVAMNGIGPNTVVVAKELKLLVIIKVALGVFAALFLISIVLWIINKRKFKKQAIYGEFIAAKDEFKGNKKSNETESNETE